MAPKKRAKEQKIIGSATEKPDYGEEGQPMPTAPNKTDAEGIDSFTQPGAAEGVSEEDATPHTTPEVTDPRYATRRALEARLHGAEGEDGERLPHTLRGALDVRRGDQIYRIPSGSVVTETELTDEEFDEALKQGIVRESTIGEVRAAEQQAAAREQEEANAKARRDAVGVKPKKGSEDKAPKGAKLVHDLAQEGGEMQRQASARHTLATRGKE